MTVTATDIREFVLARLRAPLSAKGLTTDEVPDDYDLHLEGIVDSLGILELVAAVESEFALEIDFEELDADDLTVIGPFSRYVATRSSVSGDGGA